MIYEKEYHDPLMERALAISYLNIELRKSHALEKNWGLQHMHPLNCLHRTARGANMVANIATKSIK